LRYQGALESGELIYQHDGATRTLTATKNFTAEANKLTPVEHDIQAGA
jgi:hypothetical protein